MKTRFIRKCRFASENILFFTFLSFFPAGAAPWVDTYSSYDELSHHEKEGFDYSVEARSFRSPISVIAIHGGRIERGSDILAKKIAGQDWSYYFFLGMKAGSNATLHVTSAHFNDIRAIQVVQSSRFVVSIHGFREEEKDIACVGGGNEELRAWIANKLKVAEPGVEVESPCLRFGGMDPKNIANLSSGHGVQIELSGHLRDQILASPEMTTSFARVIREGMLEFLKK